MTVTTTDPVVLPAISNPTSARVLVALVSLRWLAGITDNLVTTGLSEASAVAILAMLGLMLLNRMRLSRDAILLLAGLLAWIVTGTLSALSANMPRPFEAVALLTLLLFYALFANAALTYLRQLSALVPLRRFLSAFVVVGAVLALAQVLSGNGFVDPGKPGVIRAYGSDVHPVSFAIQIVAALLALEILRVKIGARFGMGHLALLTLGSVALYLTFARTAWVMAFLVLAFLVWRRGSGMQKLALAALALPLGILGLTVSDRFADLASLPFFWQNFSFSDTVFDYRFVDNSMSWRIVNWSYGLHQAMEQPLLGFGPGQSAHASHFSLEMHNLLLEGFFEGGMLGLGALLVTLAGLVRIHRRLPKATPEDAYASTLAGGFGLALLFAVLVSTSLVDQLMTVIMYLLLLATAGTPTLMQRESQPLSWLPRPESP